MTEPRIVAVTMVRDEIDVLPWTLPHMAAQVDHILVLDNRSVDGTRDHLDAFAVQWPDTVTVIDDPVVEYLQDEKMTRLARLARDNLDATWIVPFDADEAWYRLGYLRDDPPFDVVTARPYVFVPQPGDDRDDPNPITRIQWRTPQPEPHPKVVFRASRKMAIHMGNHGVDGVGPRVHHHALGCRHYQFRSLEQLRRKITNGMEAYRAAGEARASSGSYWRDLTLLDERGALDMWWQEYIGQRLVHDPETPGIEV